MKKALWDREGHYVGSKGEEGYNSVVLCGLLSECWESCKNVGLKEKVLSKDQKESCVYPIRNGQYQYQCQCQY